MHTDANEVHTGQCQARAWRHWACHVRLWVTFAVVLAADLVSKNIVFQRLGWPPDKPLAGSAAADPARQPAWTAEPNQNRRPIIENVLDLQTDCNTGGAFGVLRGHVTLLIVVGLGALAVFVLCFARSDRRQWLFHLGIGLVLAGAVGNIYDRLLFGQVRDFIHITARLGGRAVYPYIFNVADMALVFGVVMLVASSLRHGRRAGEATSK